jgi:tetratricopeptide (TPR) repeat protein
MAISRLRFLWSGKPVSKETATGHVPAPRRNRVGAPVRFMLLVVGVVVGAGRLLAPTYDEQLAMLADGRRPAELVAMLEQRLAGGDESPALLGSLSRAHEAAGNFQQALDYLKRYGATRPPDSQPLAKLAELYQKTGDEAQCVATLERLMASEPAYASAAALSEAYYRNGRVNEARMLLSRFMNELTLENGLLLRLAEYHVAAGAREEAIAVLRRSETGVRQGRKDKDDRERFLLAELLIQTGRSAEVVTLGKRWIVEWREAWRAGKLLRIVAADGPVTDAALLADTVVAVHPEIRLYLAHELLVMGASPAARHLLVTWSAAQTNPTSADLAAFLAACREFGEPEIVWRTFGEALAERRSDDFVIQFSEAIAAEFGIRALTPFWDVLPQGLAARRPLLAARLVFDARNIPLTRYFLDRVDVSTLDASDQQLWFDLLKAVTDPKVALNVLRARRLKEGLSRKLLEQYALLAGAYGHDDELRAATADLVSQGP